MVLDITAHGTAGHAARREGVNAIYKMADDIDRLRRLRFDRTSEFLGDTVVSVTCINAGTQHNVIPDKCTAVADVRTNEHYTNEEVYKIICSCVDSEVKARSFRLSSSHIDTGHPLVRRCVEMGMTPFGSPTLSDQALMPFPHSWSDIFISFSLQNRLKMRIIILGYFLWDVFDERGNRFLPGRGSFFIYYNPVCKEKRACSKTQHTLISPLFYLFL